jgi:hypothetical protein
VDPGISDQGAQWRAGSLGAALKPQVGPGQSPGGGRGAKPLEADEFLKGKDSFF